MDAVNIAVASDSAWLAIWQCPAVVKHVDPSFELSHLLRLDCLVHALAFQATRTGTRPVGCLCRLWWCVFGLDDEVPELAEDLWREDVDFDFDLVRVLEGRRHM